MVIGGSATFKRQWLPQCRQSLNHERVYRVMKVHGLLLDRRAGRAERRHDCLIAVDERTRRWCSEGFEIGGDDGKRAKVAFALDCCGWKVMSFVDDRRQTPAMMCATSCWRLSALVLVNQLSITIEWLSNNGSCYLSGETRSFAIRLGPRTPIESTRSNGMAEALVRTTKEALAVVHPASSSHFAEVADRVRSFVGYNTGWRLASGWAGTYAAGRAFKIIPRMAVRQGRWRR